MEPANSYGNRISNACDYINQNLDEDLTLEKVSNIAAFSKYHFHRIFTAQMGMTLTHFIQLARIKRASFRLAFEKEKRIIEIALEAGFKNPESFSRAFKRHTGQSPSAFRGQPEWLEWHKIVNHPTPTHGGTSVNVDIVHFETTQVAVLEHLGSPETVLETAGKFVEWRKKTGLSPVKTSKTFGIPYSDPRTTDPEQFRWDICGSIKEEVPTNPYGVKTGIILGGRCARVRHTGSHNNLETTIDAIYQKWLAESNEEVRDIPCFFHYLNFIYEVDECDLITDIYIPLK